MSGNPSEQLRALLAVQCAIDVRRVASELAAVVRLTDSSFEHDLATGKPERFRGRIH